ncbi:MAG: pro-sigmaK processing inhibitor BofA family protein [Oscillospiraceae bacterium]|nr:pro-sigmaK processing inhibitor BofA family protein [Oscillospiraceae bacterium]
METLSSILMIAATVVFIILLIKILSAPIRWIFKLALNALLGFVVLFIFNFFGEFIGISIPINLISSLITGFFGVPGVVFLILYQILF